MINLINSASLFKLSINNGKYIPEFFFKINPVNMMYHRIFKNQLVIVFRVIILSKKKETRIMKRIITPLLFTFLLFTFNNYSYAQSADEQKAWMDYMTPGPVHEMIAKSNGDWTEEITFWMSPDAPPTKTTATATNKMILGGRYQYSSVSGDMMGMPFEGVSILGYDNAKKIFQSTWIDNFGTGITNMTGTWDQATNTVNFTGTSLDPMTGNDIDMRQTFKIIDDNNQIIEMFATMDGKEMKTMEIKMTRK